ncbi:MAG TPA: hypothetical protein PLL09_00710 [Flavobacterium sp.]|uniref:hypothetical protein n=1 Tax=unclassified Flavobacterium TaxID=196869 RepID=UPI000E86D12A|nr:MULTISPECIES: hypothetical protein [unclassified Flavobacterium]HBI01640.1 hypothetical protein [Flavobacterium sp.]HRE76321.1 hypothetical protein [Flavobacterium sp.]
MKSKIILGISALVSCVPFIYLLGNDSAPMKELLPKKEIAQREIVEDEEKPCVFMSLMGEQSVEGSSTVKTKSKFIETISKGELWLIEAQNSDGGWGAGSRNNQSERNPHAVSSDPATTAMSAMALYRCGHSMEKGEHKETLKKSVLFLLNEIEKNQNSPYITQIRGTQIQGKLGEHIDAILTLQFFNQLLPTLKDNSIKARVKDGIQVCVDKIEKSMGDSGKVGSSGWAGVLQSSFANSSLEMAAKNEGIKVDKDKIQKAREYQKSNYNPESQSAKTEDGAGIMLYAVSSSVRNSAEEAKEVNQLFKKAKAEGKIERDAILNEQNLERLGYSKEKAKSYDVANKVYNSAKVTAMKEDVLSGFGNNGGEEFLSFLQTGESMIVNQDDDWKDWYDNIGGRMMQIQNADGSWNGHHCITSPSFCTATCLMILSIENDIKNLQK